MRRNLLVLLLAVLALSAAATQAASASAPPGATALCRDGTYSLSKHRSGTCSHHGGVAKWLTGSGTSSGSTTRTGRTVLLGRRSRNHGCRRAVVPDRRCSPGAYYKLLTKKAICSTGFHTSAIRNVPQSEKFAVEREYGMAATYYGYSIEIDHVVPLELGGSNSIANLFPEPGKGTANYHVKDRLENRLHDLVCSGSMSLHAARLGIARNWKRLYRTVFHQGA